MDKEEFWDSRASLGFAAGTNDIFLKKLEIAAILKYINNKDTILDFGCGNGITMCEIAKKFDVHILGIDFSEKMILEAKKICRDAGVSNKVDFIVGNVEAIDDLEQNFDIIYTERSIINLSTWDEQKQAILKIIHKLNNNGKYIMCESNMDSLLEINKLRKYVNLPEISKPWHNTYIYNKNIESLSNSNGIKLIEVNRFSSTYYFLSRIVNAYLSMRTGQEPNYESPVNQLALSLPPLDFPAQTQIWVWTRSTK